MPVRARNSTDSMRQRSGTMMRTRPAGRKTGRSFIRELMQRRVAGDQTEPRDRKENVARDRGQRPWPENDGQRTWPENVARERWPENEGQENRALPANACQLREVTYGRKQRKVVGNGFFITRQHSRAGDVLRRRGAAAGARGGAGGGLRRGW